jgi:hypothetical protein
MDKALATRRGVVPVRVEVLRGEDRQTSHAG